MENSLANAIGPFLVSTLAVAFGYKFGSEENSGEFGEWSRVKTGSLSGALG